MANILLGGKNWTGTTVKMVPAVSIPEQNGGVLSQAPEDPTTVPRQGTIPRLWYIQNQTNIARRLFILFDVVATIILIVLLGDDEDDLRLHPAFVHSTQAWRRQ
jgi:hypothetical protein